MVRLKVYAREERDVAYHGFNSNMVRLKDLHALLGLGGNISFNSNMVRLKEKNIAATTNISEFQFQYGAIKSQMTQRRKFSLMSFNSNMVRLKDNKNNTQFFNDMFQFQYGAIKRFAELITCVNLLSFNSNMVRLKAVERQYKTNSLSGVYV